MTTVTRNYIQAAENPATVALSDVLVDFGDVGTITIDGGNGFTEDLTPVFGMGTTQLVCTRGSATPHDVGATVTFTPA